MSVNTQPVKREWMVILPDYDDALERRLKVRPYCRLRSRNHHNIVMVNSADREHLKNLVPQIPEFWAFGGAMLEEQPKEGEQMKFKGSIMLAVAETREQVLQNIKEDVYMKAGVWNPEKVKIHPFVSFKKPT